MKTRYFALAGLLAVTSALSPRFALANESVKVRHEKVFTIEDETAQILKDVESQAYELSDYADVIRGAASDSSYGPQFFNGKLDIVRDDVNGMGKDLAHLQALGSFQTAAERKTIERATEQLKEVAATVNANIRFMTDRPNQTQSLAYRELSARLSDQTDKLWRQLHDSLSLTALEKRQERLEKDLSNEGAE